MDLSRIKSLGREDLPLEGPCPRCRRDWARFAEHDPDTENYIVECPKCGRYLSTKDELEDFLDNLPLSE